ncbi:MAG: hypothetical protein HFG40_02965 [Bacilli bacterium]|nr:hypothetical protein [Bacilli bacterium]
MKYWWLGKYKNLEVKMLPALFSDIQYFLTVPKNYIKIYEKIQDTSVSLLLEEEMCIVLYRISVTKNVKDSKIVQIIDRLLSIPDTSLPISDYSLLEMLEEIGHLRLKKATVEKLDYSNVAACYTCLNVFYIDKIKKSNKKGQCICPFCGRNTLYLDSDLIPMNYSFLFLSKIFHGISSLGCDFLKLQKIIKKGLFVCNSVDCSTSSFVSIPEDFLQYFNQFQTRKIHGEDEAKILKGFHDSLDSINQAGIYEGTILFHWDSEKNLFEIGYLLILVCMSSLINFFYLKRIVIVTDNPMLLKELNTILKVFSKKRPLIKKIFN